MSWRIVKKNVNITKFCSCILYYFALYSHCKMWRHFRGALHILQWKANSESKVQVSQLVLKVSNRKILFQGRKRDMGGKRVPLTCKGGSVVEHAEALVEETASGIILYKGEWIWGGCNPCRQNLFFSQARHIFIMNLFPVYHKPISARKPVATATKESTFSHFKTSCLLAALPLPCITVLRILLLLSS